jgi:uncharacterized delta-60 repeat protein
MAHGDLDTTFGSGGKLLVPFLSGSNDCGTAVVVDAAGRTLVAGSVTIGTNADFGVVRLLADGTLDTTFGSGGRASVVFNIGGGFQDEPSSIAIDSQGRILVAGTVQTDAHGKEFGISRLTVDGQPDTSFGALNNGGRVTLGFDLGGTNNDQCHAMTIDSRGRIVMVGRASTTLNDGYFAVARLTPSGELDSTFDGDGRMTVDFASFTSDIAGAHGVAVDRRNRIVVTGYASVQATMQTWVAAVRLSATGGLDKKFGAGGRVVVSAPTNMALGIDVAVDSRNRAIIGGVVMGSAANADLAVIRLTQRGRLDRSFGRKGWAVVPFDLGANVTHRNEGVGFFAGGGPRLAIDRKRRIVVASDAEVSATNTDLAVFRLTRRGRLDKSFGGDGKQVVVFDAGGTNQDLSFDLAIAPTSGRIVIVGRIAKDGGETDFGVTRLLG